MASTGPQSDRSDPASDAPAPPVTLANSGAVPGPFFHGTTADLRVGDELRPGFTSNFHEGRVMHHVYFAGALEPAVWGAELASVLGPGDRPGRIYVVEPTGPFEDDPNLTNKKFAGNPTRSFRTRHALRVVGDVTEWDGHPPDVLAGMRGLLSRAERWCGLLECMPGSRALEQLAEAHVYVVRAADLSLEDATPDDVASVWTSGGRYTKDIVVSSHPLA